ncbi:lysylphosphatidylglycerol synthase transmembrane domain-containing protein [Ferribacterium limneticum]|uniref:lysylphosphatidylglycerol synthase transmembrane domain-containing protein n=1 Tax=Ferribacterium limneticum TaxID=76259 RepID=UPI00384C1BAC
MRINLEDMERRWYSADMPLLVSATLLLLSLTLLNAGRWRIILHLAGNPISLVRAESYVLIGMFFNQTVFPSLAGEVAKVWLARRAGIPLSITVASLLVDRSLALAGLALLATTTLLLSAMGAITLGSTLVLPLIALISAITMALMLMARMDRVEIPAWLRRPWFGTLAGLMQLALSDTRTRALTLAMSVVIHIGIATAMFLIACSLQVPMQLGHCLALVPPVMLLTMLPVSLAGWGLREGAMVVAFGQVGIAAPDSFLVSTTFGGVMLFLGLSGGIPLLFWRRHSACEIRVVS